MADKEIYSLANSYPEMQGNPMDVKDHPDNQMPDDLAIAKDKLGMMYDTPTGYAQDTYMQQSMRKATSISDKFRK